ncbi:hypothetical protein ACFX5E_02480 [Flavobacterium sp. LS2P90]|uniref:Uncharacterized protein n=1 Tax=Flavobacterium xylosi TaxID=3230415 RepID=A0ABW6HSF8_9FLAO
MKKGILTLVMTLSIQISFSQYGTLNVNVSKPNPMGEALNRISQDAVANRIARANESEAQASNNSAYNEALKNNYSKITTDNLINNSKKYKYIVVENVGGWMPQGNKATLLEALTGAKKYIIIDAAKDFNSRGKEIKNEKKIPDHLINNKEVLFLNWMREDQGEDNRITLLSIKNADGEMVYESLSKNLSYGEILKPLISNYIYTKEQALLKIEDLKKYLDLGLINKDEYDIKLLELKPILLGSN